MRPPGEDSCEEQSPPSDCGRREGLAASSPGQPSLALCDGRARAPRAAPAQNDRRGARRARREGPPAPHDSSFASPSSAGFAAALSFFLTSLSCSSSGFTSASDSSLLFPSFFMVFRVSRILPRSSLSSGDVSLAGFAFAVALALALASAFDLAFALAPALASALVAFAGGTNVWMAATALATSSYFASSPFSLSTSLSNGPALGFGGSV
mmetsp:Transcript_9126/g.20681  ORF Transcript_9126/g.20681 Transcript_9126/m.20681 type:complete len:210 (+) Transcript_9126:98-727(+)